MPRLRIVLVPVALLAVVACTLPPADRRDRDARDGNRDTADPPAADVTAVEAAGKVNALAADLYAQLRSASGNLIFSPYSINRALALAAEGAAGQTAAELERVAPIRWGKDDGYRANRDLAASVTTPPSGARHKPELTVANSLWLEQGHPWKKEYLATGRDYYRAGLFEVNFRGNPKGARAGINRWVEKETHNRIKDLVPADAIDSHTRMVLANAIYFKARWAESFKKEDTKTEDFTLADGKKVRTPLMYQKGEFRLWETDGFQVLKLPYDGRAASMYVLLPKEPAGLPALEQQLTATTLTEWTTVLNGPGQVNVWLPRFKFTVPTELADALQKMGVKDAFDPQKANFKGMTESPEGLFISRVIHKALVETDEVGTEAAAATAVTMALGAVAQMPPPPVRVFRADHPFVFVIKHEPTGAVLFIGRVLDPTR
jgi:serpin B